jgi:hypothetical protein
MHRTEHAGAKNGGGWWGLRVIAKAKSKKIRRRRDRASTILPDGWVRTTSTTCPERHA